LPRGHGATLQRLSSLNSRHADIGKNTEDKSDKP
jgi:hypothetical protein